MVRSDHPLRAMLNGKVRWNVTLILNNSRWDQNIWNFQYIFPKKKVAMINLYLRSAFEFKIKKAIIWPIAAYWSWRPNFALPITIEHLICVCPVANISAFVRQYSDKVRVKFLSNHGQLIKGRINNHSFCRFSFYFIIL